MCAHHETDKKSRKRLPWIYLGMILLGIFSGLSGIPFLEGLGGVISESFIRMFKCISLPIIALSLIVTLSSHGSEDGMGAVWKRTLAYTLTTTVIAAAVALGLYLLIAPEAMPVAGSFESTMEVGTGGYFTHLSNIIPDNIFSPFLEYQVMGVLLVGMMVGIAIRHIKDPDAKKSISCFFRGAHGVLLVITGWIVKVIPIGLYGFITVTTLQLKGGMELKGIGKYLLVVIAANLVQGFVILPLWLKMNKQKPFVAMKGMLPALSLAFFSKSSTGALAVTMDSAEKKLGVSPKVSKFVLPLCTSINMNGCAAFIFTTVIFVMQSHGITITPMGMVAWVFIATVAAVGNAGVPMGCFFLSASLLASMNVPITLLGVILPFYSLIDMVETSLNVWSDSCVAKVVDQKVKQGDKSKVAPLPAHS